MCQMTGLNRAGYYRWRTPPAATPLAMELRHELQQTALQWPAYGYRRITAELRRRGFEVNDRLTPQSAGVSQPGGPDATWGY